MPHLPSKLHEERLDYVMALLRRSSARRLLDLGCGSGSLLCRVLRDPQFEEVVGLENSGESLMQARASLADHLRGEDARLRLVRGSFADRNQPLQGFDAAVMLETIEHVRPQSLSAVEMAVFGHYRPGTLLMTTPNREFNVMLGLGEDELRDSDHKFEWSRAKFRAWASGVAARNGYAVTFGGIGEGDPYLGPPTQTAVFSRIPAVSAAQVG